MFRRAGHGYGEFFSMAPTAQLSLASSSNSSILGHSSAVPDPLFRDSTLSAIKLRSLVAWARLESIGRHRGGCAGEGGSGRLDALDSLAMKFKCEDEGISGVQGACALRPRARDGRVASWSGAGNEVSITSAGRGVWHTVRYLPS